jgi:hypothetical protein
MDASPVVAPLVMILPLLFLIVGVAGTILWIWMIVDCATKEKSEGNDKSGTKGHVSTIDISEVADALPGTISARWETTHLHFSYLT